MFIKIIGLLALVAVCRAQKVPVQVYYESLCPDSQKFITEQLYPILSGPLSRFVDLKLIPYGKTKYITEGSNVNFTCHHGPGECYGNKVQACAISNIQVNSFQNEDTKESKTLDYINCLMKAGNNFPDSIYPGKKCAVENQILNWDDIETCAKTETGSKLLQENGDLTNALTPSLTSVPTVTFKHQYDRDTQSLALSSFQIALCKQISAPIPHECSTLPNSANSNNVIGLTLIGSLVIALLKMY